MPQRSPTMVTVVWSSPAIMGNCAAKVIFVRFGRVLASFHEKCQSLLHEAPEQPTAKLSLVFKMWCIAVTDVPTAFNGFVHPRRAAADVVCDAVEHLVTAPE